MNEPIQIHKDTKKDPELTADQYLRFLKERNDRRIQWFFLGGIAVVTMAFLTPLVVWLTRVALG